MDLAFYKKPNLIKPFFWKHPHVYEHENHSFCVEFCELFKNELRIEIADVEKTTKLLQRALDLGQSQTVKTY